MILAAAPAAAQTGIVRLAPRVYVFPDNLAELRATPDLDLATLEASVPAEVSDLDPVDPADRAWWVQESARRDRRAEMRAYYDSVADRECDREADVSRYLDRHEAGLI